MSFLFINSDTLLTNKNERFSKEVAGVGKAFSTPNILEMLGQAHTLPLMVAMGG